MPSQSTDPQLTSALGIAALRRAHPELPPIAWGLTDEGHLFATAHDPAVFAAYAEVLGGTPMGRISYGSGRACDQLFAVWQDVEFSLAGLYTTHTLAVAS